MKHSLASLFFLIAAGVSLQAADASVKISNVHLCCKSCVTGVEKAVNQVDGVKATVDKDEGTVSLTGPNHGAVQKAADALVAAGYYGKSSDPAVKLHAGNHGKGKKVHSLEVKGVHLCCGKCVSTVNEAVTSVAGVKGTTAAKNAESFTVTGDFNDAEVLAALQKAGLSGQIK
jgi:copper chaperone CopZ